METTEKIVEAYVRHVRGWLTIPNVKCKGQFEVDLLAIDGSTSNHIYRYHIESGVSISGSYSRLTNNPFSTSTLKQRVNQAAQRRTLGYFNERKFSAPSVIERLREFGFLPGNYEKVIVSWGWDNNVPTAANLVGIKLWDFRDILNEIAREIGKDKTYYKDDTLRTLQLMAKAAKTK